MSLKAFFSSCTSKISFFRKWYVFHKQQIRARIKVGLLIFFCGSIFFVGLYAFVRPPFTPLMVWRCIQQINDYQWPIWQRKRVPIEDISPYMVYAVIAAEDNSFVTHFGFDVTALQNAIEFNLSHKGSLLGGSTITQQTAKNLFLWPNQDFVRKGFEAYFSLLMEALRSKERIMEVYLNDIEFGNGIYGVEAAAEYYFHTTAKKLTSYQASLLAAILPNPRYYQKHLYDYWITKRKNQISSGISRVRGDVQTRTFVRSLK
ncbi:MAG: monofunctional biosynthetic peptidoglycan transglycosylase [candidate division SR1 bacterium]|nr:monofunctional biosynthetic peptidoglycan transglycosylase [candidate division SR1 bacterium]